MRSKTLDYYLQLPYKVEIFPEENGEGFTAIIPELPGCMTASEDFSDLESLIQDAKRVWIEVALKHGDHIPEPAPEEVKEYSGKFLVRVPKSLHRELSVRAEVEGTSLNQLIVAMLADATGRCSAKYEKSIPILAKGWIIDRSIEIKVSKDLPSSFFEVPKEGKSWSSKNFIPPRNISEVIPL